METTGRSLFLSVFSKIFERAMVKGLVRFWMGSGYDDLSFNKPSSSSSIYQYLGLNWVLLTSLFLLWDPILPF